MPQLHGSQYIEIIKPLPLVSGDGWKLKRRLVGVHENSAFFFVGTVLAFPLIHDAESGIIADQETLLVDASAEVYTRMFVGIHSAQLFPSHLLFPLEIPLPPSPTPPFVLPI